MNEIATKRLIKKWLKDTKAVSPIIATLLMIVISVVAGVMIYGWISGFIETGVPSTPTTYIVTISTVTVDNVADGNSTVLKVKMKNPGAKDVSLTSANFIVTNSSGYTYDNTNSTGDTDWTPIVYKVSSSSITATTDIQPGATEGTSDAVILRGGATQTLYVEIWGCEAGATTGALDNGDTYIFNTQDATTFDGDAVTSAQKTFKANL